MSGRSQRGVRGDRDVTGCTSNGRGTEQFFGAEGALGMTYRFAPNVALDLVASYLWAGRRLQQLRASSGGPIGPGVREADDVYKFSTRLRFTY